MTISGTDSAAGRLDHDRYRREIVGHTAALADVLRDAPGETPVPSCPEWTLADLAEHVVSSQLWVAALVTARSSTPPESGPAAFGGEHAGDGDALAAGLLASGAELDAALREAGPRAAVWSFTADTTSGFWARRFAHETAVHAADGLLAVGRPPRIAAALAADGVTEALEMVCSPAAAVARPALAALAGDGRTTLVLHALDSPAPALASWRITRTVDGPRWQRATPVERGTVTMRGPAQDLLLLISGRVRADVSEVSVDGDTALLDHWLACASF